jgi:hypothetical protein
VTGHGNASLREFIFHRLYWRIDHTIVLVSREKRKGCQVSTFDKDVEIC